MSQNITLESKAKRSSIIQNRRFLGILPGGKYKGFYITASGSNLVLGLSSINPATLLDDGTNILLTEEGIRIEEDADIAAVVTLAPGDPDPRIDLVATKHRYSAANEPAEHVVIPGLAAPSPIAPDIPVDGFQYVVLAQVTVGASATDVDQTDVNNLSLVAISVTTQPLVSLSDVSPSEADAFQNMNAPSLANPTATIQDITDALLGFVASVDDLGHWKVSAQSTPSSSVDVTGGRAYNPEMDTTTVIAAGTVGPFAVVPSGGDTRTDLIVVNQTTQAFAVRSGVVNGAIGQPLFADYPVARVFVNETSGVVIDAADITDVKPLFWRHDQRVSGLFYEDGSPVDSGVADGLQASEASSPGSGNRYLTNDDLDLAGADSIGYVPSAAGNWVITAPDDVANALDRAVARLALVEEIPIVNKELFIGETPSTITKDNYYVNAGIKCTLVDNPAAPTKRRTYTAPSTITGTVSSSGLNGLDFGTLAINTWYHIYLIGDSTNISPLATVFSANASAPTYPTGYDISRRIGSMRTNGSSEALRASSFDGWTSMWSPQIAALSSPVVLPGATIGLGVHVPPGCRKARMTVDYAASGGDTLYTAIGTLAPTNDVNMWKRVVAHVGAVADIQVQWMQHLDGSSQFYVATASALATLFDVQVDEYFEEL